MIIRPENGAWIVTRQIDHGHQSGVLASRWGNELFARPIPFDELVDACDKHDEAWRYLDEHPSVDQTSGEPHSFMTMPLDRLLPVYRDGAERVGKDNPYGGFLVAMHYQGFFNQRFGLDQGLLARSVPINDVEVIRTYLASMEMMRGRLRSRAIETQQLSCHWATAPSTVHAYLMLQVVDVISLFLCLDPTRTWPLGWVPRTPGGTLMTLTMRPSTEAGLVHVEPWPFQRAGVIELNFPVRRLVQRRFESDDDLRQSLHLSPWEHFSFRVAP
ncbi:DUF3891 family protein [bacterium]|nr:DUF3891 family protein [bacterium]